jgi:hypothetical protein
MVLGRMGLLDDAIREHLELKRLKGADPGDVAREERDALGEGGSDEQAGASAYKEGYEQVEIEPDPSHDAGEDGPTNQGAPPPAASAGQETIELDMDSVLASSSRPAVRQEDPESETAGAHPPHTPEPEESLEWEMPADQELDKSDENPGGDAKEEPVEDVLEETPDFLRETPEQDRLWFEQRPPRDFDFNE